MNFRKSVFAVVGIALSAQAVIGTTAAMAAPNDNGRVTTYHLQGDQGVSKFEGIGVDQRSGAFYVSEVTGGEIHRGYVGQQDAEVWKDGGVDGRYTARGITVDDQGRVYIAGGPNGIGTGRPDVWVYSPEGELLAALRMPGTPDAFLNDVAIGPDGAAYFTNSNDPQIFRVANDGDGWKASVFADGTGKINRVAGFNLGGIVLSTDKSGFIVAQGNVGVLWRVDAKTGAITKIDTTGVNLIDADGLVRQGNTLSVVQNFSRLLTTMKVSADGSKATLVRQQATDPSRVLTTAKELHGRTLYVDSRFEEAAPNGPFEIITNPVLR